MTNFLLELMDCCSERNVKRTCLGICMGSCELSDANHGLPYTHECEKYEQISTECCRLLNPSNTMSKRTTNRFVVGRGLN